MYSTPVFTSMYFFKKNCKYANPILVVNPVLVEIVLYKMRDFKSVSMKIRLLFGVKFLQNSKKFFHKCSLKNFLNVFLQNVLYDSILRLLFFFS